MTDDKIRDVLELYEMMLNGPPAWDPPPNNARLDHLLTMIPKMREMLDAIAQIQHGTERHLKIEKLMRWLGFMQGVLWSKGIYSIDELRAHNMPEGDTVRPR